MQPVISPSSLAHTATAPHFAELQTGLLDYASRVEELATPNEVLDRLHATITKSLPLRVLGAARFPIRYADWDSMRLGKSAFLHKELPEGFWEEYDAQARGKFRPN